MQTLETKDVLSSLEKSGQKLTVITSSGGRMNIVTKGLVGGDLAYSKPRGRKKWRLLHLLSQGVIVMKGHCERPKKGAPDNPLYKAILSHEVPTEISDDHTVNTLSLGDLMLVDSDSTDGQAVMDYLKKHTLFHTLTEDPEILLYANEVESQTDTSTHFKRTKIDIDVYEMLVKELGPPVTIPAMDKVKPPRKSLFTPKMVEQLKKAEQEYDTDPGKELKPLFKLFPPEGSASWLVYSLEEDGDTLKVIADLGIGCVEYGPASLRELEAIRTKTLGLPIERDRYWTPPKMGFGELLGLTSLQDAK